MKEQFFKYYNFILNKYFSEPKYHKILTGKLKGKYLYMPLNTGVRMFLGVYEHDFSNFIYERIENGSHCLDVGSHIGYITLLMANKVGTEGRVISFEPMKRDCDLQEKSVKKNGFKNVIINNFGLGDKNIKKKAYVFDDSWMAHFGKNVAHANYKTGTEVLELKKLDDYYNTNKFKRLDYIKIDVEGYEHNVLYGGAQVIDKYSPKIFIEVHSQKCQEKVFDFLTKMGYKIFDLNNKPYELNKPYEFIFHIYAERE